jgi:hypothetical protein
MIHQRLDYCQDNFVHFPFRLSVFTSIVCSYTSSHPSECYKNTIYLPKGPSTFTHLKW